jgi:type III secretory pathway component EscV
MKKFMSLLLLLLVVSFTMTGCKREKKAKEAGKTSAEQKIEEKTEAEDLLLTEKEVKAFLKAFPVFVEITRQKEKEVKPLTEKEDLMSGVKLVGEFREYKEELDGALKEYGFTYESFALTYGKVRSTVAYRQMEKVFEETGEGMKKMLDNPLIPESEKGEIRKSLEEAKESEESEEMKACKENWKIVKKYEEEIIKMMEEK